MGRTSPPACRDIVAKYVRTIRQKPQNLFGPPSGSPIIRGPCGSALRLYAHINTQIVRKQGSSLIVDEQPPHMADSEKQQPARRPIRRQVGVVPDVDSREYREYLEQGKSPLLSNPALYSD